VSFCTPWTAVSHGGVALGLVVAGQGDREVRRRRGRSGEIRGRWLLVWRWLVGISTAGGSHGPDAPEGSLLPHHR
jgi:hypothetical protein